MKLYHKGTDKEVIEGTVLHHNGESITITGGRPPHKPGSSGRVWTKDSEGHTGEYFPHVFDLEWR